MKFELVTVWQTRHGNMSRKHCAPDSMMISLETFFLKALYWGKNVPVNVE